ncbi:MAG TPA: toxic anion resistance protein [Candidatus Baltobacteraceae bacterium]|nr:toxic anion resistance protein [Candidatus Baltobacteraceae bacterium]
MPPDTDHSTAPGAEGEGHAGLTLSPPEPVLEVRPDEAEKGIVLAGDIAARIDAMASAFVDSIVELDPHGDEYRRRLADINEIGEREIVATSEMSNRLLDRPVRAVSGVLESKAPIARNLVELRHTVDDLNPARYDLVQMSPRKLLGVIPLGDRLRNYFDRYSKAQSHIQAIIRALNDSRGELQADNAAIAQEERALWTEMETLRQYAYLARVLDDALEQRIDSLATSDASRARTLREDVLFPVRHRLQDILTQLAVAAQGYAALRVVQQNNQEVVRAIQTATTTTAAALRTAVMVAQALTDQRLVLDQLKAVNETTSGMIESTSALLKAQTADVEAQTTSAGVDLAALQRAWDNVFATLDQIDSYKSSALATMKVTVRELTGQVERSRAYVEHLEQAQAGAGSRTTAPAGASTLRLS